MAVKEDYEVVPHQILADLRSEVEALKKKLLQPDAKMNELVLEIESMKDAIHELNSVFSKVLDEMKGDDPAKLLKDTVARLDSVVSQNETIAKGMIAISDKVEEWMEKQSQTVPPMMPNASTFSPAPSMMPRMAAPPIMPGPMGGMGNGPQMGGFGSESGDFPPPPPSMMGSDKRKLIGGIFK